MKRILLITLLAVPVAASAFTYHVSTTGSDANNGLSSALAWRTLQHAADEALAGDSVVVDAGTYVGFAAMDHSGTAQAPIVFTALGAAVLIDEPCPYNDLDGINVENVSWVVIEGFTVVGMPRTGIRLALSDHITIRYNTCSDNYKWGILTGFAEHVIIEHNTCSGSEDEHGIYFSNSADDPIIRHNHCFNNRANGIHMNGDESLGGDGIISNAQVYGNVIHGNGVGGGSGINCDGVANSTIHNNLLYDNHASGISLYRIDAGGPSINNTVYNNTIVNAADARWCVNITDGCTGNRLLNNILVNLHPWRGSIVVAADALPGFVSDHNIVTGRLSPDGDATILDLDEWQALGHDANSIVAAALDDLFVNAIGGDFHAAASNAPQVDAGTDAVSAMVTSDLDGTLRPIGAGYDIGCYELDASTLVAALVDGQPYLLPQGDALLVAGAPAGATVEWYDAQGKLLSRSGALRSGARLPMPENTWSVAILRHVQGTTLQVLRCVALR